MITDCKEWNRKGSPAKIQFTKTKSVALSQTVSPLREVETTSYDPFILHGYVSLSESEYKPVSILRDTGSTQSFILEEALPFSSASHTGASVLVRGIEMGCAHVPLHKVNLQSDLVSGLVDLAVCAQLPVKGVQVILGNDLAGGKVFPCPVVSCTPVVEKQPSLARQFPTVFSACVVTRAQKQKSQEVIDLSDLFVNVDAANTKDACAEREIKETILQPDLSIRVSKEQLAVEQKSDPSLVDCVVADANEKKRGDDMVNYFWDEGILMRKWRSRTDEHGWYETCQIVLPTSYRLIVLKLAHENVHAGHLGVNKTFHRLSKYFFWPGLKTSVAKFCRECEVCQKAGKTNQKVPPTPLCPIPVLGEPFERVIVDCVGPLPKAKSGHQYVLSIMCAATRFPEAVPLRSLKTQLVVKELVKSPKENTIYYPFSLSIHQNRRKRLNKKTPHSLQIPFSNIYPLHNSFEYHASHTATGSGSGDIRKDIKRDEASPLSLL